MYDEIEIDLPKEGRVKVNIVSYCNGKCAITIVDVKTYELLTILSRNLVDDADRLGENEFYCKDGDENESIAAELLATEYFESTGRGCKPSGSFVTYPIWKFIPKQ